MEIKNCYVKHERLYVPLTVDDLKQLRDLALKEHKQFLVRNPYLKKPYYNSLIAACLCQGAASHYLNSKIGIKDFDIWHFYVENESINFPHRAWKRIEKGYKEKPIDFLKRAIPRSLFEAYPNSPERVIKEYMFTRNTATKKLLLKKAVIGLFPNEIFGKVLWRRGLNP
jgi:hypothetical protein